MEEKNIYQKLFEVKKAGITLQRDTKAFNYQYATLDQIQKKLWEVLQEQGLIVIHAVLDNKVVTEIRDTETEKFVASKIELTEWTKPQDKGSEITYYRRYNLLSLLDLEVQDDDGKKAQDSKPTAYAQNDNLPWIGDDNIKTLKGLIDSGKTMTMKGVREKYKVSKANADILKGMWII